MYSTFKYHKNLFYPRTCCSLRKKNLRPNLTYLHHFYFESDVSRFFDEIEKIRNLHTFSYEPLTYKEFTI